MRLWNEDRDAYFADLKRFFTVHCDAMAKKSAVFIEQVKRGPALWASETERRISQLPALPDTSSEVHLSPAQPESGLGMCGVLRPIVMLERLNGVRSARSDQNRLPEK
jgi:hypothetical protein